MKVAPITSLGPSGCQGLRRQISMETAMFPADPERQMHLAPICMSSLGKDGNQQTLPFFP